MEIRNKRNKEWNKGTGKERRVERKGISKEKYRNIELQVKKETARTREDELKI